MEQRIDGVVVKRMVLLEDERGSLAEVFRVDWGPFDAPVLSVHLVGIRPGKVKGWGLHAQNDDRLFVSSGTVRFGLYDDRPDSPTYRMLNVLVVSDRTPTLITVPHGVYHALKNIGTSDATVISMPTELYVYEDPDKYRLPVKNDKIPFAFEDSPGW